MATAEHSVESHDVYEGERRIIDERSDITAVEVTSRTIRIQWELSSNMAKTSNHYIKCMSVDKKTTKHIESAYDENEIYIEDLSPNTNYQILVYEQDIKNGLTNLHDTVVKTKGSKAEQLQNKAEKLPVTEETFLPIYKMKSVHVEHLGNNVRSYSIIKEESGAQRIVNNERTILLLGNTGAGKSTIIDALFNHLAEVCPSDEFRFKLTDETKNERSRTDDQALSQTETTTCYSIPKTTGLFIDYSLNIIDTPGYNDTANKDDQSEIIRQFKVLLSKRIEVIHAICIVMPLASFRLTNSLRNMIEGITELFAINVKDIFYGIITFDDGGEELYALTTLQTKMKIKFNNYIRLSNGKLFKNSIGVDVTEKTSKEWTVNDRALKKLLDDVFASEGKSLMLTQEVLNTREMLAIQLNGFQDKIAYKAQQVVNIIEERRIYQFKKEALFRDECFQYVVRECYRVLRRTPNHQKHLNCKICKRTCHEKCSDICKRNCRAFENGKCVQCINECTRKEHSLVSEKYVLEYKDYIKTDEHLKKQYSTLKDTSEALSASLEEVDVLIIKAKECMNELKVKALRQDSLSIKSFVEIITDKENEEQKVGFSERVQVYKTILANINSQQPASSIANS